MPFIQLQFRRDTSNNWACTNPVLASGEMGIEIDTHMFKIGDGGSPWVNLPYGGIQGPRGPQGPSGNGQGVTGPQGLQGLQGPLGPPGQGVPVGGTSGQILAKIDSINYNTQWISPPTNGNYYIELTYPTTSSLFDRGTYPSSVRSTLPPSYSVSLLDGSVRITNSNVTNSNSWQLLLGPMYVQYASGAVNMTTWLTNQTWEYWSPSAGIIVNTAGVININDSSFGNLSGSGAFSAAGDGSSHVMVRLSVTPFFFN